MLKGKKTIIVNEVKEWANIQLKRTDIIANYEFKAGISCMITNVLMSGGNYNGFRYLSENDSDLGEKNYYDRYYY
jgi:hypothetical protein